MSNNNDEILYKKKYLKYKQKYLKLKGGYTFSNPVLEKINTDPFILKIKNITNNAYKMGSNTVNKINTFSPFLNKPKPLPIITPIENIYNPATTHPASIKL
jgi:hypothetical protein